MGNGILPGETGGSPGALRSAERAIEPRYSVYVEEAQRLIQAGIAELAEKGRLDPRVSDIVRRAGLSNKAFYRHFKSKDELLLAVLEEMMRQQVADFEARVTPEQPPVERIRAWIWAVLESAFDTERAAAQRPLLVHQGRLLGSLSDALWGHVAYLVGLLQSALEEAKEQGQLDPNVDPGRDAEVIYYMAMGWMHGRVIAEVIPPREEAERVVEYAMRGLGVEDA